VAPPPSPAGGGGGDAGGDAGAGDVGRRGARLPRRSLASRRRARAPGRRNRWWSALAAAGLRVAAMWVPGVGEGWMAGWMGVVDGRRRGYLKWARAQREARALGGKSFG
jgi:hypothetical protein